MAEVTLSPGLSSTHQVGQKEPRAGVKGEVKDEDIRSSLQMTQGNTKIMTEVQQQEVKNRLKERGSPRRTKDIRSPVQEFKDKLKGRGRPRTTRI